MCSVVTQFDVKCCIVHLKIYFKKSARRINVFVIIDCITIGLRIRATDSQKKSKNGVLKLIEFRNSFSTEIDTVRNGYGK